MFRETNHKWPCNNCKREYTSEQLRRLKRVSTMSCLWRRCSCGWPISISAACTEGAIYTRAKNLNPEIRDRIAVKRGKKLPQLPDAEPRPDLYTKPPFWAKA